MTEENKNLKFAPDPTETLAISQSVNRNAATIRYDDEKQIEKGDTINVLSHLTEEKLGTAEVKYVETVPAKNALGVVSMRWAEYPIKENRRLLDILNKFYEEHINGATEVKVIILEPDLDNPDEVGRTSSYRHG